MSESLRVYCPTASSAVRAEPIGRSLGDLRGATIGFIDNAKPNFQFLVDDLAAELGARFGIKAVRKHRKPGQVPVDPQALQRLAEECDAVITGSGD